MAGLRFAWASLSAPPSWWPATACGGDVSRGALFYLKNAPRPALRPVRGSSTAPAKSPKRRATPVHLALLSPETQERFQLRAQTMRKHMQVYAKEATGKCVAQSLLQRFCGEPCDRTG